MCSKPPRASIHYWANHRANDLYVHCCHFFSVSTNHLQPPLPPSPHPPPILRFFLLRFSSSLFQSPMIEEQANRFARHTNSICVWTLDNVIEKSRKRGPYKHRDRPTDRPTDRKAVNWTPLITLVAFQKIICSCSGLVLLLLLSMCVCVYLYYVDSFGKMSLKEQCALKTITQLHIIIIMIIKNVYELNCLFVSSTVVFFLWS